MASGLPGTPRAVHRTNTRRTIQQIGELHRNVVRLAGQFAQTAVRLDNAEGWGGIRRDAQRFADAVHIPTAGLPGRLLGIYGAFIQVAAFLDTDRRIREGFGGSADPLTPDRARELGNLVDATRLLLGQFAGPRRLDRDLAGPTARRCPGWKQQRSCGAPRPGASCRIPMQTMYGPCWTQASTRVPPLTEWACMPHWAHSICITVSAA